MQKTLNEVIMTHCTNNENTKLVIINNLDNATGNIWLAKNKVAHATLEEVSTPRTGLAALYKILSWNDYKLYILDNCVSREISIEKSPSELKLINNFNQPKQTLEFEKLVSSNFARKSSITSIDISLVKIIEKLNDLNVLDGFIGAAIIDNSGKIHHSTIKKNYLTFNASCNFAFSSFKFQQENMNNMSETPLKIIILESNDKINAIYKFQDKYILYLCLNKPEANLGLARSIINNLL